MGKMPLWCGLQCKRRAAAPFLQVKFQPSTEKVPLFRFALQILTQMSLQLPAD